MSETKRLGRGIEALLGPVSRQGAEASGALPELPVQSIRPNPYQPRARLDEPQFSELVASLETAGLLQPIVVRKHLDGYQLIAGERRWRAAQKLGWARIPAVIKEADDRTLLTLALIENLQRDNLSAIEEATSYQRLIDEFHLGQAEVARLVGRDRSTVANALRLLKLPPDVAAMVDEGRLSEGHARAPAGDLRLCRDRFQPDGRARHRACRTPCCATPSPAAFESLPKPSEQTIIVRDRACAPRLSVLTPLFRYEPSPMLRRFAQAPAGVEFVLLDDGSASAELVANVVSAASATGAPARIIVSAQNLGRAKARNRLIAEAQGEYVLFLDADMLPDTSSFLSIWLGIIHTQAPRVAFGGLSLAHAQPTPETALHFALFGSSDCQPAQRRARRAAQTTASSNLLVERAFLT